MKLVVRNLDDGDFDDITKNEKCFNLEDGSVVLRVKNEPVAIIHKSDVYENAVVLRIWKDLDSSEVVQG